MQCLTSEGQVSFSLPLFPVEAVHALDPLPIDGHYCTTAYWKWLHATCHQRQEGETSKAATAAHSPAGTEEALEGHPPPSQGSMQLRGSR